MSITATVFDNAGNFIKKLDAGTTIGIFRQAQYTYGHCLGKLHENGESIGWGFAHCMGEEMCSRVEVVNIKLDKGQNYENTPRS